METGRKRRSLQATEVPSPVRVRIISHARRHFFIHGFRRVTMADLAGELGMSKKTLYAHFESKAALLDSVIAEKFREVDADLGELSGKGLKGREFTTVLHGLLGCVQRHLEEVRPPFVRDVRREPAAFEKLQRLRQGVFQRHFGEIFEQGRRAGLVRKDIPPGFLMELLLGVIASVMNPQKISELDMTPKVAFMMTMRVVLEGVLTAKGRENKG